MNKKILINDKSENNRSEENISKDNRRKAMVRLIYGSAGVFSPVLLLYLFLSFYYNSHFYSNSIINGISASNMTANKVEDAINAQVKSYILTLEERNGVIDQFNGEDIGLHTVFDGSIKDLLIEQNGFAWPISLLKSHELKIKTMIEYDEPLLKDHFDELKCLDEANIVGPLNAHISEYGNNGYEIIPEDLGAKVNEDKLYEAIKKSITFLEPSLSIEDAGCYEEPEINSEYPKLVEALNELNKIAGAKITYEFGENTEILDGSLISKWLSVNDDYMVNLDPNSVKEYVDYIGKTYNSFGKVRAFQTSYGKVLKIKGGDYGWWLNRPQEVSELTELILNGEELIREPAYFQTAGQYGQDDIGDTYVEVNLTAQHLFFYKDGILILESDFVSGNISKKLGTPTGTYPIQYKETDSTLNGEDYATPVKYWMPFNRNIGFHDAPWRKTFGKDIYLTNGSHGCINMPPAKAKKLYKNMKRGVAVVVYELKGTESYKKEVKAIQKAQK